jgi:hypothetical protein
LLDWSGTGRLLRDSSLLFRFFGCKGNAPDAWMSPVGQKQKQNNVAPARKNFIDK